MFLQSKNCRLCSKNYYLKIPVRVCMCARMYARAYECGQIAIRTHDKDRHTTSTPTEHTTTNKAGKPAYIGKFADNEKKVQKKVKKNLEIRKKVVTL